MNHIFEIVFACGILGTIIILGKLCNKIRIKNISLGCVWILLVGLFAGQVGLTIASDISTNIKDFALSVFIFEIGLEVGPKLFGGRKGNGFLISVLAFSVIALGGLMAAIIGKIADVDIFTLNGIMSGAVSNTPALGAAQKVAVTVLGSAPESIAQGYALAYPIGIVGVLAAVQLILGGGNVPNNGEIADEAISSRKTFDYKSSDIWNFILHVVTVLVGVTLGRLIGGLSLHVGNLPSPFALGNTGGTLISAIVISTLAKGIVDNQPLGKNTFVCNIALSLFMATVGITSGDGFVKVLLSGGYKWVFYGAIITLVPCFAVMPIAKYLAHLSNEEVCGILTGATTNSPVFAYCEGEAENPVEVSRTYACIYPVALFARIIISQVFVLAF